MTFEQLKAAIEANEELKARLEKAESIDAFVKANAPGMNVDEVKKFRRNAVLKLVEYIKKR
jgi:hypothetical protein